MIVCDRCNEHPFQFTFALGGFEHLCGKCFFERAKEHNDSVRKNRRKPIYYMVKVDFEYMADNSGNYTTKITEAGRLRMVEYWNMVRALEQEGITSYELVETNYKLGNKTPYLSPGQWLNERVLLKRA
jgi:hypothetical protein